jgi:phage repressor protein C with HTH and peptisase S24 domain
MAFKPGELLSHAHLQRTPSDVREVLQKLVGAGVQAGGAEVKLGINLDDAYLSGVLQQMVERVSANVEMIQTHSVPVINRVSAGYPSDFTDLSYPPRVADEYVGCPEVNDKDAFAARVHGDSMTPKYKQGDIVIFSPAADPREGDDCFVRFEDGQTTFKRVFFENDEEGAAVLRLQPRNEKYRPQVVSAESVSGLYRAMYRYQRVDEEEGKG